MFGVLSKILCWIEAFGKLVLIALIDFINLIIHGLVAVIQEVIAALPNMPDPPNWDGTPEMVIGTVNWLFPVGVLVTTLAAMAVLWLAWQAIAIILRWGKAV